MLALPVVTMLCASSVVDAQTIANGGFDIIGADQPHLDNYVFTENNVASNWSVGPNNIGRQGWGTGFGGIGSSSSWLASENVTGWDTSTPVGYISNRVGTGAHLIGLAQTLTGLDTTLTYSLSFDWVMPETTAQASNGSGGNGEAYIDGVAFASIAEAGPSGQTTQTVNYSFTPSSSSFVLNFGVADVGDSSLLLIDNVSLEVVPEPSSAILLGLGLLGLANRRRR